MSNDGQWGAPQGGYPQQGGQPPQGGQPGGFPQQGGYDQQGGYGPQGGQPGGYPPQGGYGPQGGPGGPGGYPPQGGYGPQAGYGPPGGPQKPGGTKAILWVIIGIVVLAGLGVGAYFLFFAGDDTDANQNNGQGGGTSEDQGGGLQGPDASDIPDIPLPGDGDGGEGPSVPELPSMPEVPEIGGEGEPQEVAIGETFTFDDGAEMTINEVQRDFQCSGTPLDPDATYIALDVTFVSGDGSTMEPMPGLNLTSPDGSISTFDAIGCASPDEEFPSTVNPGEEAQGLIVFVPPSDGTFTLEYEPLGIAIGDPPPVPVWTID